MKEFFNKFFYVLSVVFAIALLITFFYAKFGLALLFMALAIICFFCSFNTLEKISTENFSFFLEYVLELNNDIEDKTILKIIDENNRLNNGDVKFEIVMISNLYPHERLSLKINNIVIGIVPERNKDFVLRNLDKIISLHIDISHEPEIYSKWTTEMITTFGYKCVIKLIISRKE